MKSAINLAIGATAYLACALLSLAQSTLDPSECINGSGVTAFPNCNYLYDTINYCDGSSVPAGPEFVSCYCNQALFNAFFDCESEQRLCFGDSDNDGSFLTGIAEWHSACDKKITYAPTTPVVSSIIVTFNKDWCGTTVPSACAGGTAALSQCSLSYGTTGAKYASCFCQPKIISLDYTCEFLGNVSCYRTTAATTNLVIYPYCSNAAAVLANIGGNQTQSVTSPAFQSASTTTASMTAFSSTLTTSGPSSGATAASPSPSSTKASAAAIAKVSVFFMSAAWFGAILMAFILVL